MLTAGLANTLTGHSIILEHGQLVSELVCRRVKSINQLRIALMSSSGSIESEIQTTHTQAGASRKTKMKDFQMRAIMWIR